MNIQLLARPEILALKPYVSARMQASGEAITLDANECPWTLFGEPGWSLNRYPDPQPEALLAAMATRYGVPEQQLLVTRGSDEGIDLLLRAFCRPGQDRIIDCPPCFGMYRVAASIQGAGIRSVPLVGELFELDVEAIIEAAPDVRLVFLCSPNNPTGASVSYEQVLELCERLGGQSLVVVDEAYVEFADSKGVTALAGAVENLVVLRTLSKAYGLAGARCGVVIAAVAVIEILRRIISPYPLPRPSVEAALQALDPANRQLLARSIEKLKDVREQLAKSLQGLAYVHQVWDSEANFVLARFDDGSDFYDFSRERGVLLRDFGDQPGLQDCLRISCGSETDMQALDNIFSTYKQQRGDP
jgi:histidinol-phosphate aminotransferase